MGKLRDMIRFYFRFDWQHSGSLAWAFSSLFVSLASYPAAAMKNSDNAEIIFINPPVSADQ
jgi:hypothetical protein